MLGRLGAGKSMLARRLTTILPAMTLAEAIETTRIHRVAGLTGDRSMLITTRPFRASHHTISDAGLIGGGHVPRPGEGSLAHHGVLFLDELPECRCHVLEVLRQVSERRCAAGQVSGERYRHGEGISMGFVEPTVNHVISKRFWKKQQMG
jgi:magnesium chelatase family protein